MPDGDHEPVAEEYHDLADLDQLRGFVVRRGLEHDEQAVVVLLQLRPLVGVNGVLDRQRVRAELQGDVLELGRGGLVQPHPDEALLLVSGRHRRVQGQVSLPPFALHVDGAVHDHAA